MYDKCVHMIQKRQEAETARERMRETKDRLLDR